MTFELLKKTIKYSHHSSCFVNFIFGNISSVIMLCFRIQFATKTAGVNTIQKIIKEGTPMMKGIVNVKSIDSIMKLHMCNI